MADKIAAIPYLIPPSANQTRASLQAPLGVQSLLYRSAATKQSRNKTSPTKKSPARSPGSPMSPKSPKILSKSVPIRGGKKVGKKTGKK
jgi:hypothetical protein